MHGIWFWVFMSSQWHCSRVWYLHPQYTHINTHSTISTHNTYIILTFTCTCMHFLKSDLKLKYQFPSARRGWTCFIQVFFSERVCTYVKIHIELLCLTLKKVKSGRIIPLESSPLPDKPLPQYLSKIPFPPLLLKSSLCHSLWIQWGGHYTYNAG